MYVHYNEQSMWKTISILQFLLIHTITGEKIEFISGQKPCEFVHSDGIRG